MRFVFSEFKPNYSRYYFPYQVFGIKEEGDSYHEIYSKGFLASRVEKNLFYLARSLRVNLNKYEPNSENRRIFRKTEFIDTELIKLSNFEYHYSIGKMGKDFYEERFGKGKMSAFKLKWIFTSGFATHTFVFRDQEKNNQIIGYCPVIKDDKMIHYMYPFYDLDYFKRNAGMGMMTRSIELANGINLEHIYLGTCYTKSSLYKLQFDGLEYFTGYSWSDDIDKLKSIIREEKGEEGHILENYKLLKKVLNNK